MNLYSRRRLIYSQLSSPPAQPTHGIRQPIAVDPSQRLTSSVGADDGTRTRNRRFTKPLLYQLSYVGACKGKLSLGPWVPANDMGWSPRRSSVRSGGARRTPEGGRRRLSYQLVAVSSGDAIAGPPGRSASSSTSAGPDIGSAVASWVASASSSGVASAAGSGTGFGWVAGRHRRAPPRVRPRTAARPTRSLAARAGSTASYRRIEPATAALSEVTWPCIGNADDGVAAAPHDRTETLPFAAHDDHDRPAKIRLASGQRRVGVGADDRRPRTWRSVRASARSSTGTRSRCSTAPGRRLDGSRRERRLAVRRVHDAVHAAGLGGSEQRAEVRPDPRASRGRGRTAPRLRSIARARMSSSVGEACACR